jgi:hypothetical protein
LRFNESVEIPGRVLPAGTFSGARTVSLIEISFRFPLKAKHMFLRRFWRNWIYRSEPTDKTVVTFEEQASGSPEALHNCFYPGDTYGVELDCPNRNSSRRLTLRSQRLTRYRKSRATRRHVAGGRNHQRTEVNIAQLTPPPALNNPPAAEKTRAPPSTMPDTLRQTAGNFASVPIPGGVTRSSLERASPIGNTPRATGGE